MPELPEVEAARRAAQAVARGRRITDAHVANDPIVFEGVAPARIRRALLGRRVKAVRRHGKHLWLELDRRPWPCLHFGMTGGIHLPAGRAVRLVSDGRRLGRIRLRRDPASEPPIAALGWDALHELPSPARFHAMLRERRAPM